MKDLIGVQVGQCLGHIQRDADLMWKGRGEGLSGHSKKLVRLSSISSIRRTGSPNSGS